MKRREILINRMQELEASGKNCNGCAGTCCTYEANSMMVTPIEAFELVNYLKENHLFDETLRLRLRDTISKYRLDHAIGSGKRSYLRRTYTCPFFNHRELGCPLPREIKPYGCLAFNAHDVEFKAGEHCYSEKMILEKREEQSGDDKTLNEELKQKFSLYWDKSPLPLALLDFYQD